MSKQNEIAEYKKKIADLTRQTNATKAQKEELLLALQRLNIEYQQRKIGYLEYSHRWSEILAGRAIEEHVDSYDRQVYELVAEKRVLRDRIRAAEKIDKPSRTLTLAASLIIIIAVVAGLAASPFLAEITGFATSDTEITISNATIQVYVSIARSGNLTNISFSGLNIGSTDNNATNNYNASDQTDYFLVLSSDSNVDVDFCIKADDDFENKTDNLIFGIGNLTWANSTTTDTDNPHQDTETTMNKTYYLNASLAVSPGSIDYYRFWLDVPADQAAGDYNNTIGFKAVQVDTGCN